jgi:lipopolysaccharide transport system permease protein
MNSVVRTVVSTLPPEWVPPLRDVKIKTQRFFATAWRQRHFVPAAISGEFRSRVVRSKIGTLWFVLHPLAMALVYVLILSEVLGAKLGGVEKPGAYAVYLLAGMAGWSLFMEVLNRSLTVFIEYGNAMKKINFPKIFLPLVVVGGALVNNLLLLGAVIFIIAFYGFFPSIHWLGLILAAGCSIFLALGLGLVLGIFNIFTRDVGQVMLVVTNVWFWMTPVVYSKSMISGASARVIDLNPLTPVVEAYQDAIVHNRWPDVASLGYPALLAAVAMLVSTIVFWRASPEIVDAL